MDTKKVKNNFSDPSMRRYLTDIRKTKPCSRESEQEMFRLCRKGSEKARTAIISANMRFVLKVVLHYRGCPIPLPDLISIGALGLVKAIDNFDHTRGLKFISYAVWWIKAYLTKAINEEGSPIRLPANQYIKIRQAINPTNKLQVNDEIRQLIRLSQKGISFDTPLKDGSASTFAEVIADTRAEQADNQLEIKSTENYTRQMLNELPEREADILRSLYGIGCAKAQTLREVGENLNLSHERVRQLRVHELSDEKVRFVQYEEFSGFMLPIAWPVMSWLSRRGFNAMNKALKKRMEQKI